jgi:His-Xaa-Ser system protein HxsD
MIIKLRGVRMARDVFSIDNMEVHKNKGNVIISVNPKLYPLDTIFSAAYIFIDKAYVIVDGDPNEEIIVQLKAKDKKTDLQELGKQFNNELINYSFYAVQTARNMPIRAAMVQRAFFTQAQQEPKIGAALQPREQPRENVKKAARPRPRRRKVGKGKSRKRQR